MRCLKCGSPEDKVIDSRPAKEGAVIRRRRECLQCGFRFTTYEQIEGEDLRVIKRDGRYEAYDRRKILDGIEKACEKRPVSRDAMEQIVSEMTEELSRKHKGEIPTVEIGEKVMQRLRQIDEVAYVRFASVYRKFRDIKEFVSEVQNLNLS